MMRFTFKWALDIVLFTYGLNCAYHTDSGSSLYIVQSRPGLMRGGGNERAPLGPGL